MTTVKVALPDRQEITSAIARESAEDLGLQPGNAVIVVMKSTEVMLATPD